MNESDIPRQPKPLSSWMWLFVLLFPAMLYLNTVGHDYTYDDFWVLSENKHVQKGIHGIPEILSSSPWEGSGDKVRTSYRPLSLITFALEQEFFSGNPHASHAINVLLYSLTGLALFLFLRMLFGGNSLFIPAAATFLFLAHPLHTEVVANIKSRDEILCFLFFIAAFSSGMRYIDKEKPVYLALMAFLFFISLISKEHSIALILILPLAAYFFSKFELKKIVIISAVLISTIAVYLFLKNTFVGAVYGSRGFDYLTYTLQDAPLFAEKIPAAIKICGKYISLLVFPHPLVYDYSYNQLPAGTWGDFSVYASLAVCIALVIWSALRAQTKEITSFAVFFFFISMAAPLGFTLLDGGVMAERLIYLPSLGFCIALAVAIEGISKRAFKNTGILTVSIVAIVASAYSLRTVTRNTAWKDNFTLYSSEIEKCKNNARAHYNLGSEIVNKIADREHDPVKKKKLLQQAVAELKKSASIYEKNSYAYNNMGIALAGMGDTDAAEGSYRRAIEIKPDHAYAHNNLGNIYLNKRRFVDALESYSKAEASGLTNPIFYNNRGMAYLYLGKLTEAERCFIKAIQLKQDFFKPYENLGLLWGLAGDSNKAEYFRKKALELQN